MVKDMRGVDLVVGDIVLWNNTIMTVKEIHDGIIHQITGTKGNQAHTQMMPAKILCTLEIASDPSRPIPGMFKLTQPEEKPTIESLNNKISSEN